MVSLTTSRWQNTFVPQMPAMAPSNQQEWEENQQHPPRPPPPPPPLAEKQTHQTMQGPKQTRKWNAEAVRETQQQQQQQLKLNCPQEAETGGIKTDACKDTNDSLLVPPKQNELKVQDTTNTKHSQTQQQKKQQKKVKAGSKKQPYAQEPKQQQQQQRKCEGEAEGGGIKPKAYIGGEYCSCVSASGCSSWAIRF